jgi:hypothetical protein
VHTNPVYTNPRYPGFNIVSVPGWIQIDSQGSAGGGTDLGIVFGAPVSLGGEVVGIYLEACFEIEGAYETVIHNSLNSVFFALDAHNGAAWRRIAETESWVSASGLYTEEQLYRTHTIRFLLNAANMNGITAVHRVRAVLSAASIGGANPYEVRLGTVSLGGIVLRGGVL